MVRKNRAEIGKDKLRFDLIPPGPLTKLAEAYTVGAKKHGDRDWEDGERWGHVFAAIMRHLWKWWAGEKRDPDGQHHLAAAAHRLFALMEYEETHPELDDRGSK